MNCNTTHYRANSSSVPGDPTPRQGEHLEFPLTRADWQEFYAVPEVLGLRPGEYVCLHPGASTLERCWPPERFAAVADTLAARGLPVVLTGTARETALTGAVAEAMRHKAINLAGRTGLGALGALLSQARLLVCNDTGVSHLAAALRLPSVVIFTQSNPDRWAPLDRQRHRVLYRLPGSECIETNGANGFNRDIVSGRQPSLSSGITPEMVLAEVELLLRQTTEVSRTSALWPKNWDAPPERGVSA